jgi:hypothetical protein
LCRRISSVGGVGLPNALLNNSSTFSIGRVASWMVFILYTPTVGCYFLLDVHTPNIFHAGQRFQAWRQLFSAEKLSKSEQLGQL